MDDLKKGFEQLSGELAKAVAQLKLPELQKEQASLEEQTKAADFWSDNQKAQTVVKRQSQLKQRIEPWQSLQADIADATELLQLGDASLQDDLTNQLAAVQARFDVMKGELKLAGPYDDHNALLSIFAGAGGTDAQDWAQMLLRMYVRYAEKAGFTVKTLDESAGDEAGLKSVLLEIDGTFAYGKLKGEHGVHRLVRLSPFNADNLRQTSFAKVEVTPKIDSPNELIIDEKELKIDVYRSGGKGGQSVNTTDSAVRITHLPTNIVVAIQNERSQLQNRETAMGLLRSRLAKLRLEQHAEDLAKLKGPNQSAEWGNQIRSYVLHPYKMVKDLRTNHETSDPDAVLDGNLEPFIEAYLETTLGA